jgi:uncharacterized RDD family membrane protein YckC
MNDMPDYSKYSRDQLIDVMRNIDRNRFPDRYALVESEISKRPTESQSDTSCVTEENKYETFGRRVGAGIIDGLILWPMYSIFHFIVGLLDSELVYHVWHYTYYFLPFVYSVYFHYQFGQTFGKMATGVAVFDVSEEHLINLYRAILRDSVPILYTTFLSIYLIIFSDTIVNQTQQSIANSEIPFVVKIAGLWWLVGFLWFLAEVISMLFNKKKRAIHDFMANSVVVRIE